MAQLPLRPNVCMLVYNKKYQLFLGERFGSKGVWQFPQGGVDLRSLPIKSVVRELREELGLKDKHIGKIHKLKSTHSYNFSSPPDYALNKWRGQKQTFWLVEFLGTNKDIKLDCHEQELMNFKWCSPQEIRKLAEPKRLIGYLKPLREFEKFVIEEECGKVAIPTRFRRN